MDKMLLKQVRYNYMISACYDNTQIKINIQDVSYEEVKKALIDFNNKYKDCFACFQISDCNNSIYFKTFWTMQLLKFNYDHAQNNTNLKCLAMDMNECSCIIKDFLLDD